MSQQAAREIKAAEGKRAFRPDQLAALNEELDRAVRVLSEAYPDLGAHVEQRIAEGYISAAPEFGDPADPLSLVINVRVVTAAGVITIVNIPWRALGFTLDEVNVEFRAQVGRR